MPDFYVYILTNKGNTTLYTGITNDIVRRFYEHKSQIKQEAFSTQYNLLKLVYYEIYSDPETAISREKFLKKAFRKYKISLINKLNPTWQDLSEKIV